MADQLSRPKLSQEDEKRGYIVVHFESVRTELIANLALRPARDEYEKGYDDGARQTMSRALNLISKPSFMKPGWPWE